MQLFEFRIYTQNVTVKGQKSRRQGNRSVEHAATFKLPQTKVSKWQEEFSKRRIFCVKNSKKGAKKCNFEKVTTLGKKRAQSWRADGVAWLPTTRNVSVGKRGGKEKPRARSNWMWQGRKSTFFQLWHKNFQLFSQIGILISSGTETTLVPFKTNPGFTTSTSTGTT